MSETPTTTTQEVTAETEKSSSSSSNSKEEITAKALEAASKIENLGKEKKYRKIPKAMKYINVLVQIGLILFAFANIILTVVSENSKTKSKGYDIYFKVSSIALPAIPVFWSRLLDASKNFNSLEDEEEEEEKNEKELV